MAFDRLTAPPIWVSVDQKIPTSADADNYGFVWTIALDAHNRPYPSESFWKHVRRDARWLTHWASPPVKVRRDG